MNYGIRELKRWVMLFGLTNFIIVVSILICVLLLWRPWDAQINANTRKISITGSSILKAEPDEFRFNPSYNKNSIDEIKKLNTQIVATLKNIGVKDDEIKNNASNYGSPEIYYLDVVKSKQQITLGLTITVSSKKLAQKVQDYLLTTNPVGMLTPIGVFSTKKQKELMTKARKEAINDAKTKADQTARGLGTKISKVIEIAEGASIGGCGTTGYSCPIAISDSAKPKDSSNESTSAIGVQPGTNEFGYSFTVTFALD